MADLSGFNANEVEPQTEFEALPAGKYVAAIVGSEMKPTKAGTGEYLQLRLQVLEGPHKNRLLFDRLNLKNPNQQAVEISQATLSAICRAVGVLTPKDSAELHDIPLTISVKVKPYNDGYTNEIGGYSKRGEATTATPSNNGDEKPPWER